MNKRSILEKLIGQMVHVELDNETGFIGIVDAVTCRPCHNHKILEVGEDLVKVKSHNGVTEIGTFYY